MNSQPIDNIEESENGTLPDVPYFSIVMPMYNRESTVERALDSCLSQSFTNWEVIVVDDGSADSSVEVVSRYCDPRVRIYRHETNRGVCPARNTAISHALGKWLLLFDSDDELLPDALNAIYERTRGAPSSAANLRFMCRFDSGEISPEPPFSGSLLDYQGYVRWLEVATEGRHEAIVCMRRAVFEHLKFPDNRALESLFHLDFAKRHLTLDCPDVVRLYHQDAPNSLCASFSGRRLVTFAPDEAHLHTELLSRHGDALRELAPRLYLSELRATATFMFLAGRRRAGLKYSLRYLRAKPASIGMITVSVFGLWGPSAVVFLKWMRSRLRRARMAREPLCI